MLTLNRKQAILEKLAGGKRMFKKFIKNKLKNFGARHSLQSAGDVMEGIAREVGSPTSAMTPREIRAIAREYKKRYRAARKAQPDLPSIGQLKRRAKRSGWEVTIK